MTNKQSKKTVWIAYNFSDGRTKKSQAEYSQTKNPKIKPGCKFITGFKYITRLSNICRRKSPRQNNTESQSFPTQNDPRKKWERQNPPRQSATQIDRKEKAALVLKECFKVVVISFFAFGGFNFEPDWTGKIF